MTNRRIPVSAQRHRTLASGMLYVFAFCGLAACNKEAAPDNSLPALAASNSVTVSGISSGGYMAGQFLVAYSAGTDGAAIAAAGPWGCAKGDISRALKTCISGEGLELAELQEMAAKMAGSGEIDALTGLADARLFLFRGAGDAVIGEPAFDALQGWFGTHVAEENIVRVDDVDVVHGWPTLNYGEPCDSFAKPYINNCGYDLAGNLLQHLYGDLAAPSGQAGALRQFDQSAYGSAGLADNGYAYIPEDCEQSGECKVHIFFHGCEQSADTVGTTLAENAGFNRWAESNRIIVLYPQAATSLAAPMNPLGCWDWWGYTGPDYLSKAGGQLSAVRRMAAALQEN